MESLNVVNQSIAKPSGVNNDLRFKRRNGINQFQFEQQMMSAKLNSLQSDLSDLIIDQSDEVS